ncbi:hypothetical protein RYX36_027612 [Vicia faba]
MTEANNLRDARRRRRILQQGSDRLAFIQGRIQTLPPPGFSLIKTIISFRPLYLVLLTNSSFVVAKIISGKQRGSDERLRRRRNSASASASADSSDQYAQLAKTLEIGMVLKTVADAVFMDCAVYAIVLICSLSLVHH